jgi:addiction module HigA family antidote
MVIDRLTEICGVRQPYAVRSVAFGKKRTTNLTYYRVPIIKGRWKAFHSIRINDQWRVVFRWEATQAAFAEKIGWTKTRLNELIKGKRGITAAAALDLADAIGTSPKLWMNLQATYDLDKAARVRRVA